MQMERERLKELEEVQEEAERESRGEGEGLLAEMLGPLVGFLSSLVVTVPLGMRLLEGASVVWSLSLAGILSGVPMLFSRWEAHFLERLDPRALHIYPLHFVAMLLIARLLAVAYGEEAQLLVGLQMGILVVSCVLEVGQQDKRVRYPR